jgi:glutathione synthase/RimK-type ligase-like ATP-grasp enzyme
MHSSEEISQACIKQVKYFGLTFGAIDLVQSQETMYFLEITQQLNGGWLAHRCTLPIAQAICNCLDGFDD